CGVVWFSGRAVAGGLSAIAATSALEAVCESNLRLRVCRYVDQCDTPLVLHALLRQPPEGPRLSPAPDTESTRAGARSLRPRREGGAWSRPVYTGRHAYGQRCEHAHRRPGPAEFCPTVHFRNVLVCVADARPTVAADRAHRPRARAVAAEADARQARGAFA